MKAILCTRYGPPEVLRLQEIETPVPKDNEVLVSVCATTVSSGDVRMRRFDIPVLPWLPYRLILGLRRPRNGILGTAVAGEVAAVGQNVKAFKPGDPVFGSTNFGSGTYAEYTTLPEDGILAVKPTSMTNEEAAALFFGGHTALHFLRKGKIQRGQSILIYGASGAVGTYAVQLAKHFGAHVTAICGTAHVALVESLGADHVVDYTQKDFSDTGQTYDIIFDTVGKSPFLKCVKALSANGYYLRAVHLELPSIVKGLWISMTSSKKIIGGVAHEKVEDLIFLQELVEAGNLRPVIDRSYPLDQIVDAHRYVENGHKKGSVVITV